MKKKSCLWLPLATLLAVALPAQAAEVPAYQPLPGASPEPLVEGSGLKTREELEIFLDGVMTAQMRAQQHAGSVITVVKDGELFFAKGYGWADVEKKIPVDPAKTLFRPGSVSKLFTWTALMQLVEQGKVKLDADVNESLTQFKMPDTYPGMPVTVRDLLTHTSGTEDGSAGYLIVKDAADMDPPAEVLGKHLPKRVRPPANGNFGNGDMASYSNWCTALAGLIVENVSGMGFDDYLDKHLFGLLGMADSTFRQPLPAGLAQQMSKGYGFEGGTRKEKPFEFVNMPPAGSLSATGTDMAKFMIAHLQLGEYRGVRILGEATARQMHGRALSLNPYTNGAALGFYENHINGRRIISHGGDTQWFHSELNLLPEEGIGIFYSTNSAPSQQFSVRYDLMKAFMDRYYPARLPEVKAPADFSERVVRYAGTYRFNRHSYTTLEKIFGLAPGISVVPSDRNTLLVNYGLPVATEWVEIQPDVFRRVDDDATLAFSHNADGRTYLLNPVALPSMPAYRLHWHEKPGLHWLVLGFGLLCFIVAAVSSIRNWTADGAGDPAARMARRVAGLLAACQLVFLVLFGAGMIVMVQDILAGFGPIVRVSLVFPLLAIPLTLAVLYFSVMAWRKSWWTAYGRFQYTVIALASAAFLWSLNTWNAVGFKID